VGIKRLFVFIFIIILLGLLSVYYPQITGEVVDVGDYEKEVVFVDEVIDGDTIELENGERVRLLGVNTPERGKFYYDEAKNFLKEIEGEEVEILRDAEDVDKYGRKLRYVFYEDRLLNVEILERGLGTNFMIEGLRYEDKLRSGENFAQENKIGLWAKSEDVCADCIKLIELNIFEEFFVLENKCVFDCSLGGWIVKDDANHFFKLEDLDKGEKKRFNSTNIWNNEGDRFFMRDAEGGLVLFWGY